jgi:hypothetical protein
MWDARVTVNYVPKNFSACFQYFYNELFVLSVRISSSLRRGLLEPERDARNRYNDNRYEDTFHGHVIISR